MALCCFPLAVNAAKDYVLTNGVITLADRPPESLAGTFRLGDEVRLAGQHGDITYSEFLALEFHSASASFTLRTGSLVFFTNGEGAPTADFTADVNAVGLALPTVRLRSSGVGGILSISDTNETQLLGTMSFLAVEVPRPQLSISRTNSALIQISWPTNFTEHKLEFAASLPAAMWDPVTNGVAIEGDRFKVNLPTDRVEGLYRLRKQ